MKIFKFLNILFFFFSIVTKAEENILNPEKIKNSNNSTVDNTEDNSYQFLFGKKYDLFLPKYDFQRPYKFRKEQYSKLIKYASDHKRKNEVPKDVYIMTDDLIQEYEEVYKKEILYRIINKEVNLEEVFYDKDVDVYAYPDLAAYREQKPKFILNEDHQMKNYDNLGNFLKFSHKKIEVVDK